MKVKKVLCVFAHPDDESFGPGGTITAWAKDGAIIHLLCATKGEIGQNAVSGETAHVRARELKNACTILGIQKVTFLGYRDGQLSNTDIKSIRKKVETYIRIFKPDTILTFDLSGVSGHIDHVVVANAVTSAFDHTRIAKKLYYYTLLASYTKKIKKYFIHFPQGKREDEIHEAVDISSTITIKISAIHCHKSQKKDSKRLIDSWDDRDKREEVFLVRLPPHRSYTI